MSYNKLYKLIKLIRQNPVSFVIAVAVIMIFNFVYIGSKDDVSLDIDSEAYYKVTKVSDGDTFRVNIGGQDVAVRMLGIDTPETVDPRKPVQCFGKEASDIAKKLLVNRMVRLETDGTQGVSDKYDRVLAYVYRDDGLFVNKYLLENGYAHEYTYSIPYALQSEFQDLEDGAREADIGLWDDRICDN